MLSKVVLVSFILNVVHVWGGAVSWGGRGLDGGIGILDDGVGLRGGIGIGGLGHGIGVLRVDNGIGLGRGGLDSGIGLGGGIGLIGDGLGRGGLGRGDIDGDLGWGGKRVDYYSPPKYEFDYGVSDGHTGDNKQQSEVRRGDVVQGEYSLKEPDGTIRIVRYEADDKNGFNAKVIRKGAAIHPDSWGRGGKW